MDNVVPIDPDAPYRVGPAECRHCGHKWVAIVPLNSPAGQSKIRLVCSQCKGANGWFLDDLPEVHSVDPAPIPPSDHDGGISESYDVDRDGNMTRKEI